jgi:hypothetical protein
VKSRLEVITGHPPVLLRIAWRDIPEADRQRYRPTQPLYQLQATIRVLWREWDILMKPGFITDVASIPWAVGLFGVHRNNRDNWMDLGAVLHDGFYCGAGRFTDDHRRNRLLADQLMRDCWLYASGKNFRPRFRYWQVRMFGRWFYQRDQQPGADTLSVVRR